ncbi:hypothetical protein [Nonlabens sp. Asnod2-A12]|uniref:hypothetical protein n=1 Tax=Nonlabens sp. Asnod2-A12 TaxID=3160578 RepID=UPI0038691713
MSNTQLLFLGLGLISILLLYYSIIIFIKAYRCKQIAEFALDTQAHDIIFNAAGFYKISFIGCRHIKIGSTTINLFHSQTNESIPLKVSFPNVVTRSNGVYGVEYWSFKISQPGTYTLKMEHITDVKSYQSQLLIKNLFSKPTNSQFLKIRIKEGLTILERISSIVGLVLGVNGLASGIMIGIFNLFDQV